MTELGPESRLPVQGSENLSLPAPASDNSTSILLQGATGHLFLVPMVDMGLG